MLATKKSNRFSGCFWVLIGLATVISNKAVSTDAPPPNPYLADSSYNTTHADSTVSAFSTVPGPMGDSRQLKSSEIKIAPVGFANAWEYLYSSPYPNGKRAIFAGGRDRILKLDADSLEVIHTLPLREDIEPANFYPDSVEKLNQLRANAAKDPEKLGEFNDRVMTTFIPALREGAGTIYKILSRDNVLYMAMIDAKTGEIYVAGYGDSTPQEFSSTLKRHYCRVLPQPEGSRAIPMAINMTFDGHIIVVLNEGTIFSLTPELDIVDRLILPEAQLAKTSENWMTGIVRNGISIDPDGGIYVVSRTHLHKVMWQDGRLSLDTKKGAWSESYRSGVNGSGTTATPIGWSEGDDQLVVMLDGGDEVLAYWRDQIPEDWQGIDGHPRRVAGTATLDLGRGSPADMHMEASPIARGYGFFWQNDTPLSYPGNYSNPIQQIFAKYAGAGFDQHQVTGGVKYLWNPQSRKLEKAWVTELQFAPSICTPNTNGLLYCLAMQGSKYSVEALDWESGESVFSWILGEHFKFNPMAVVTRTAPNGSIDTSSLGAAIMRITPEN